MSVGEGPGGGLGGLGRFPALEAVVLIEIAGGAERLVVEADAAGDLGEFFGEEVNGLKDGGGSWNLEVGVGEELLVASIDEPGYFSADQSAGAFIVGGGTGIFGMVSRNSIARGGDDNGGCTMFGDEHGTLDAGKGRDLKSVGAKDLKRLIEVRIAGLGGHDDLSNLRE